MADQVTCAIHGKNRTLDNMEMTPTGLFACKPGTECSTGGKGWKGGKGGKWGKGSAGGLLAGGLGTGSLGGGLQGIMAMTLAQPDAVQESTAGLVAKGHVITHPEGPEMCHAHGARRSPHSLYQVMTPEGRRWECMMEDRCRVSSHASTIPPATQPSLLNNAMQASTRFSPYGGQQSTQMPAYGGYKGGRAAGGKGKGKGKGWPVTGGVGVAMCALHQKQRSLGVLAANPDGTYSCTAGNECRRVKEEGTGEPYVQVPVAFSPTNALVGDDEAICMLHKKKRKIFYLADQGGGMMVCVPGFECRSERTA